MSKATSLFNIVWVNTASAERSNRHIISKKSAEAGDVQTINFTYDISCMILYPSLVVPEIVWGDESIEIVLIGREFLDIDEINERLRFSPGLDAQKKYYDFKLTDKVSKGEIEIENQYFHLIEGIPTIEFPNGGRFGGIPHKGALEAIINYSKSLSISMPYRILTYVKIPSKILKSFSKSDPLITLNVQELGKEMYGQEEQDVHIYKQLTKLNGKKIRGMGRWGFKVDKEDVDFSKTTWSDPIQSYHPVFYYDKFDSASFYVLADTHLSTRQKILKRSNARVIEYPDDSQTNGDIGDMVNICSANTKKLLDEAGNDDDIKVVLIAGDLIDFIMNAYSTKYKEADAKMNAKDVWELVKVDDESSGTNYQDFVDLICFYSIILDFYRKHGKPIYVVSGNHDCYYEAFGISPRKLGTRANPGIAADHNLTFCEAILAFGETYDKLLKPWGMPFKPEMFIWFYTVLSPFHDFAIKWSKQSLVGFGWGSKEDALLDVVEGQEFIGHLGRAEDAVSNEQLGLMERFDDSNQKLVILSHFTFASFKGALCMNSHPKGYLEFAHIKAQYGDWDQGTYEKNRVAIYRKHMKELKSIQCTISGHSHRRGIYTAGSISQIQKSKYMSPLSPPAMVTVDRMETTLYDFDEFSSLGVKEPLMIVSDSSGSIPRYNKYGEFSGWGSYPASGVKILTFSDATISSIAPVWAGEKPRIAVVMEYIDIEAENRIITNFARNNHGGKPYKFRVELNPDLPKSISIDGIVLYSYVGDRNDGIVKNLTWLKISLLPDLNYEGFWNVASSDESKYEYVWTKIPCSRGNFISLKFKTTSSFLKNIYNFDDAWEREFQFGEKPLLTTIEMDADRAEVPDFEWRRKHFKNKY